MTTIQLIVEPSWRKRAALLRKMSAARMRGGCSGITTVTAVGSHTESSARSELAAAMCMQTLCTPKSSNRRDDKERFLFFRLMPISMRWSRRRPALPSRQERPEYKVQLDVPRARADSPTESIPTTSSTPSTVDVLHEEERYVPPPQREGPPPAAPAPWRRRRITHDDNDEPVAARARGRAVHVLERSNSAPCLSTLLASHDERETRSSKVTPQRATARKSRASRCSHESFFRRPQANLIRTVLTEPSCAFHNTPGDVILLKGSPQPKGVLEATIFGVPKAKRKEERDEERRYERRAARREQQRAQFNEARRGRRSSAPPVQFTTVEHAVAAVLEAWGAAPSSAGAAADPDGARDATWNWNGPAGVPWA